MHFACRGDLGEEAGLSEARYVVANMLSRSDSWGRSTEGAHRGFNARGAVLERPAWERDFGGPGRAGDEEEGEEEASRPGVCGGFCNLTDAEGEVGSEISGGDMSVESLVNSRGRLIGGRAWPIMWQRIVAAGRRTEHSSGSGRKMRSLVWCPCLAGRDGRWTDAQGAGTGGCGGGGGGGGSSRGVVGSGVVVGRHASVGCH